MLEEYKVCLEINKTNNLIQRNFRKSTVKKELEQATGKNGWIIGFLAEHQGEDIFQKDIEDMFSIRRSTVSNMMQLMERKGYVKRESVDYDARLKKLTLTPKSEEIYRKITETLLESEEKITQGISGEELEVFFKVLRKIQQNLEQ